MGKEASLEENRVRASVVVWETDECVGGLRTAAAITDEKEEKEEGQGGGREDRGLSCSQRAKDR